MTGGQANWRDEQRAYWAREGEHWVDEAARYDAMNGPFGDVMLDSAELQGGDAVLDIGCGTGATTVAAARRVGRHGKVVGIDLSPPMLRLARRRAEEAGVDNLVFLEGDAQTYPFDEETFDVVISRFGTMFFASPETAFANLRRALKRDGRLSIVVWQDMFQSEWIAVPGAAAAEHVGLPDFGPPDAPGPFALADPDRIRDTLHGAGFRNVTVDAVTKPMRIADNADDATTFITSLELVRNHLFADKPDDKIQAATEAARAAFAAYERPDGVVMKGGAWLAHARG